MRLSCGFCLILACDTKASETQIMTTITISLPDDRLSKLKQRAEQAGVAPEELLRAGVEEWLSRSEPNFSEAADYVLTKNAELYRRLA